MVNQNTSTNKIRIGIDARVLDRKITGTGRYLLNLMNEIPRQHSNFEFFVFSNSAFVFNEEFYNVIRIKEPIIPYKLYSPYWINITLPKLIKKYKIDILFCPNVLVPFRKIGSTKKISVVHDAIFKVFPEYYPKIYRRYLSFLLPKSLNSSDLVITVSNSAKEDILKYFKIDQNKIKVIYNTASENFKVDSKNVVVPKKLQELNLPQKYILFVGVIETRKNILSILKTVDRLIESNSKLKLVLVGRPGYNSNLIEPEINKRKGNVLHIAGLGDDELFYLYKNAFLFFFPSYYEGFGIPPLEAMKCSVPTISSNTSSLVEVVADGGIMKHPEDIDGFVSEILKLENDMEYYNAMKNNAYEQSKKFDITVETKKLLNIFIELSK